MFINIVQESIETNVMDTAEEIELVLKGHGGDREEYWNNPDIPIRCKSYMSAWVNGCSLKCQLCNNKLCGVVFSTIFSNESAYLCSTCVGLVFAGIKAKDIIIGEGNEIASATKITTYKQIIRISRLRKHQKGIRAVLTLLNHRSELRLPHDLIRTLKGYLY